MTSMIDPAGWLHRLAGDNIQPVHLGSEERCRIVAHWVAEHGIDPNEVPADARIVADLNRQTLTVEVYARHPSDGLTRLQPPDNNELMRGEVTVPLRMPIP